MPTGDTAILALIADLKMENMALSSQLYDAQQKLKTYEEDAVAKSEG